jgi:hypothetical protein
VLLALALLNFPKWAQDKRVMITVDDMLSLLSAEWKKPDQIDGQKRVNLMIWSGPSRVNCSPTDAGGIIPQ